MIRPLHHIRTEHFRLAAVACHCLVGNNATETHLHCAPRPATLSPFAAREPAAISFNDVLWHLTAFCNILGTFLTRLTLMWHLLISPKDPSDSPASNRKQVQKKLH